VADLFSKQKCILIIIMVILSSLSVTSSAGFCATYNKDKPYLCNLQGNCKDYFHNIYQIFKTLLGSWLPSLIGLCLNIIFIIFLRKIANKRKISGVKCQNHTKKDSQITIMILVISISFLMLTMPYSLFELIRKFSNHDKFLQIIPLDKEREFQRATLLLIDLNHSTNFFFYVLSAERFRNQLKNILLFWRKNASQSQIITV